MTFQNYDYPYYYDGKISIDEFEPIDLDYVENGLPNIIETVFIDRIFTKKENVFFYDHIMYKDRTPFDFNYTDSIYVTSSSQEQYGPIINSYIHFCFIVPYEDDY